MEQGRTLLLSSGSELEESDSEYIEEETGESEETSSEDTDVEHHSPAFSGEQTERQRLLHSISDSEGNNDEEQTPDNVSRTQSVSRRRRHARAPRVLGRRSRGRGRGGARPRPVFQWREFNDDFFPVMPDLSVSPGITAEFPPVQHNCDYFMAFLSDAFLDHIVSESNTFHDEETADDDDVPHSSHEKEWKNITRNELLTFIAVTLLMSHSRKALR